MEEKKKPALSEAKSKANARYRAQYSYLTVRMPPDKMKYVKEWVEERGVSLSSWVNGLIDQAITEAGGQPPMA